MMKISLINGSPKPKDSNSGHILNMLGNIIGKGYEIKRYDLKIKKISKETIKEVCSGNVIVFAFPVYVDSIPTSVLKFLIEIEKFTAENFVKDTAVYAIINCGFYEGHQARIVFEIIENWCCRTGFSFGGGIGQGAGEAIGFTEKTVFKKILFKNLICALERLAEKMKTSSPYGIKYLSPRVPRFLWRAIATHFFWHSLARKNGLDKKELSRRM